MDLRIVKTKKGIKEAFLQLRSKTSLEKVKVKDICVLALINKTTFYKHYQNIYELSEEMEKEAIELFMENFNSKDILFENPRKFIEDLPQALDSQQNLLFILFNSRMDSFIPRLEKCLISYYSNPGQTAQEEILVTFVIGGTLHALMQLKYAQKYDDSIITDNVAKIVNMITVP